MTRHPHIVVLNKMLFGVLRNRKAWWALCRNGNETLKWRLLHWHSMRWKWFKKVKQRWQSCYRSHDSWRMNWGVMARAWVSLKRFRWGKGWGKPHKNKEEWTSTLYNFFYFDQTIGFFPLDKKDRFWGWFLECGELFCLVDRTMRKHQIYA